MAKLSQMQKEGWSEYMNLDISLFANYTKVRIKNNTQTNGKNLLENGQDRRPTIRRLPNAHVQGAQTGGRNYGW